MRGRIFYGWWILAASVVIELFGLGFGIFAVATVYPYIVEEFPDWSRTIVTLPTSVIILTVGAMGPLTGAFVDRFPIRRLFIAGILVQSAALYYFSLVDTPAEYIFASFLIGLGLSGVTVLPNQVLISRWFASRIGLVNGILLGATATGAAISPALVTRIIEASGWREAFEWMALLVLVPPMLVTLLIVRDRPESVGLRPYGEDAADASQGAEAGLDTRQTVRTGVFWAFAGVVLLGGMPCYSHNKHILLFLKELGFDPIAAADHKSFLFLVAAVGRVVFGWLADRMDKRNLLLASLLLIAFGYPLLLWVPEHHELLLISLFLFGAGYGGLLPAIPILSVHYFGRRSLGTILGLYKIVYDIAAAGAPLFTSWLYDLYGNYTVSNRWLSGFAWVAVVIGVLFLPRQSLFRATAGVPAERAA